VNNSDFAATSTSGAIVDARRLLSACGEVAKVRSVRHSMERRVLASQEAKRARGLNEAAALNVHDHERQATAVLEKEHLIVLLRH
jgi:hypothetical protein